MERNQGLPTWKGAGWPHNRQAAGAEAGREGRGGQGQNGQPDELSTLLPKAASSSLDG